jgi:hypothetical protein
MMELDTPVQTELGAPEVIERNDHDVIEVTTIVNKKNTTRTKVVQRSTKTATESLSQQTQQ